MSARVVKSSTRADTTGLKFVISQKFVVGDRLLRSDIEIDSLSELRDLLIAGVEHYHLLSSEPLPFEQVEFREI